MIKVALVYFTTTGCHYLKIKGALDLKTIKKSLQKTFKDFGSEIVPESNLKIVNYLDETLNPNDSFFKPYYKLYDIIQYINNDATYTHNVIKHLPVFTNKRLANNSSHQKVFKESVIYYEDTLIRQDI